MMIKSNFLIPKLSKRAKWMFVIELSVFGFILLFGYAAFSKWMDFENFRLELADSPFIGDFAPLLVWLIPSSELVIALMLSIPRFRLLGLHAFSILMSVFTVYIAAMLLFSPHIPCICGGIISGMSWAEHLVFNGVILLCSLILLIFCSSYLRSDSTYSLRSESGKAEHLDTK